MQREPVSENALLRRINRALRAEVSDDPFAHAQWDHLVIRKARPAGVSSLGRYYAINAMRNIIVFTRVDLEGWGSELGVLDERCEVLDRE